MRNQMRLAGVQLKALPRALDAVLEVRRGAEPATPGAVHVVVLDGTGAQGPSSVEQLVAIRFAGTCAVPAKLLADRREEDPDHEENVSGTFVVIVDEAGDVVHARHTEIGTLPLRDGVVDITPFDIPF